MWNLTSWNNYTYCTINNMFTPKECNDIIEIGKSYKSEEGKIEEGEDHKVRDSKITWLPTNDPKNEFIYRKVCDAILTSNNSLFNFDLLYMEDLQFAEYNKGSFYASHKDAGFSNNFSRKLSFVLQLSDPNDYEGGELVLYESSLLKPVVADKKQGTVIVFPSYLIHEVTPITKGKRHSLVTWVHGPRFK